MRAGFKSPFSRGPFARNMLSVNLAGAAETGYWSVVTGEAVSNANWRRLPEIDVSGGQSLFIQHGGNRSDVIWMDSGGSFIQRDLPSGIASGATVTAPATARSVRINLSNDGTTYDALGDQPIVR